MNKPKPFEQYRHFKGKLYQIIALAEHTESGEELVIYQALYDNYKIYARPLSMFLEETDRSKYPDADQKYRFERVNTTVQLSSEQSAADQPVEKQSVSDQPVEKKSAAEQTGEAQSAAEPTGEKQSGEEQSSAQSAAGEEEGVLNLDPLVIAFLDADSYSEKLNILTGLHHRITDDMINVMAMASDLEIREMDVEDRYIELKNCLLKMEKFECNRIR